MKTVIVEFGEADYKRLQARASLDGFKLCDYITDAAIMRLNENAKPTVKVWSDKPDIIPNASKPNVLPTCSVCGDEFSPFDLFFNYNEDNNLILTCKDCYNDSKDKETEKKTE